MKKTTITFFTACLVFISGINAQSIEEGKNHLNSGRIESAIGVFEKMLAINPNNIEATYWLGQAILESEEIAGARIKATKELYQKGLQSSANAPLLLIGMGHVDLLENNNSQARQKFETALEMVKTRKGYDPDMLTAVGRANVDAKSGDYKYAIEKLDMATDKGKDPDTYVQLGDAYRKYGKGEGGGDAYKSYNKALEINPNYGPAYLSLAKIFESQKNWSLVLKNLVESVVRDPTFSIGYYELFYYHFFRGDFKEAEEQLQKYIESKKPVTDIQDQYLYAQLCWARKDFNCAISKAENVVNALGALTKPKVYRLLADACYQNGDFEKGKKYSDMFFAKKNPDDIILPDYEVKALLLAKLNSGEDAIYNTYIEAVDVDTTEDAKVGFLKKAAAYFKEQKIRDKEAKIIKTILELKKEPIINDYFDLALAYYFDQNYTGARNVAMTMIKKFPDQVYGYEWDYNASLAMDTVRKDSIAVPAAVQLYEFSKMDTGKYKKQYLNSVRYLAAYYINDAKDKDKSLEFFRKWQEADAANAAKIQEYIDQIEKMPSTKPAAQKATAANPATK